MTALHLVVSGSRELDTPVWREAVPRWVRHVAQRFGVQGLSQTYVHVGDARGVDTIVRETCEHTVYFADWKAFGTRAGMIRNRKMLDAAEACARACGGRVVLLAFPAPGGKGTQACIAEAKRRGIEVWDVAHDGTGVTVTGAEP